MQISLSTVFEGVPAKDVEAYKLNYGVVYEMNGQILNSTTSILIIFITIFILAIPSIIIFKKRKR